MEIVNILLRQNLVMFIYMLIGYLLFRNNIITKAGSSDLGKLLLYAVLPTAIAKSFMQTFTPELLVGLGISLLAALLSLLLSSLVSRLCFGSKYPIEHFSAAFSNAGFIGIPLVQMVLGESAVFYVSSYIALLNILQWTYGVAVITGSHENIRPSKIAKNPIVISFILGLALFFLPIKLPGILTEIMSTIAAMNAPLAMIILGTYIAQVPIRNIFTHRLTWVCSAVRLLVIPILTLFLLTLLPEQYRIIKLSILIAASAPVGSNVAIFSQLYNKNYTQAILDVCLSTILCICTMPVIVGIATLFW